MKRLIAVLLILMLALSLTTGCVDKGEEQKYVTRTREVSLIYFNTVSIMSSYGDTTDAEMDAYAAVADELLGYYHHLFDIYFEYAGMNNLRTVNKNAGKAPVKVDTELIDFLEECKELFTLTNGKTNVMMGAVLRIWHNYREEGMDDPGAARVPSIEELTAAAEHTSIDSLIIDREAGTVYISDPKASIDVGAIGKGYATERLYERLREMGADSVALNIGGNLRTIGVMPNGANWRTGVTNPDPYNPKFAARISFGETSCVTSGDYERYYIAGGEKYHHIIDPVTLFPAAYFSSITVITPDSALADALSTALFCLSLEDGQSLLSDLRAEGVTVEALWIDRDGKIYATDGIVRLPD